MEQRRKRVAVVALSAIDRDARVQRQIVCLSEDHEVTVVGYGTLGAAARPHVCMRSIPRSWPTPIRYPLVLSCTALGRFAPDAGYWGWHHAARDQRAAFAALLAAEPEIIVANDWNTLPIAIRAQQRLGARIVVDLHEYSPLQWENRRAWMLLIAPMIDYHLRSAAPRLAAAMTVNRTIADRYRSEYGIDCAVVRNIPLVAGGTAFRATDPGCIRLIHHGFATRERSLHLMIEAVAKMEPRFVLHFRLIATDADYIPELRALADEIANGRVHFEEPVAPSEIVPTIARYDIGFYILPPITFNQHAALPNKFFDFVSAGLAVCVGPSPEMAHIVEEHGCGLVVPSFDPVQAAELLNRLSAADIDAMKQRSVAACSELRPERELEVLRAVVARAAEGAGTAAATQAPATERAGA